MIQESAYGEYGTGAQALPLDWRDYPMHRVPGVAAQLESGIPEEADLSPIVASIYDQGKVPACTAFSLAALKSIHEAKEQGRWRTFDALRCYQECGGDGRRGLDTRIVLKAVQAQGMAATDGGERYTIGPYSFAPHEGGIWKRTICAAIAGGCPVVVAMLLPSSFGWESSGHPTNSYHQVAATGYTSEHLIGVNSWGAGWGKGGFWRVPWAYLVADRFQRGLCYAYTVTDSVNVAPLPAPPIPPPPPAFRVDGYVGLTHKVGAARPNAIVQIAGEGLDAPNVTASYAGLEMEVVHRQSNLLTVRLPSSLRWPAMSYVQLRRPPEVSAFCPLLVVDSE